MLSIGTDSQMFSSALAFIRRNETVAVFSGVLFSIGWWLIIDTAILYPTSTEFNKAYLSIGIMATLALLAVNFVSNHRVSGEIYSEGCFGPVASQLWLFLSFLTLFSCVITSAWIMVAVYAIPHTKPISPGIALFMQLMLIFSSALFMKFGRRESIWP
ncbi:hypothetical protein ACOME3_002338 [Neoechinorhynchus agilis]